MQVQAEVTQPVFHRVQILVLAERVKVKMEPKAIRQGDFFLDRIARMNFPLVVVSSFQVIAHAFADHVPPIGGGVDQHVRGRPRDGAIQHGFQALVPMLRRLLLRSSATA